MKVFLIFAALVAMANGCGQIASRTAHRTARVVGSLEVPSSIKFIANLRIAKSNGHSVCGGSLIRNLWVLTAAHCTESLSTDRGTVHVYLGDQSRVNESVPMASVAAAFPHSNYNPQTLENDIMLIKLSEPPKTVDDVVRLPRAGSRYPGGTKCIGLGYTAENGTRYTAGELQQTKFSLLSDRECSSHWSDKYKPGSMICARAEGAGEDGACKAQTTGGPLICEINGSYHLVGVASFERHTCSTSHPTVFARVSAFRSWIDRVTMSN